MNYPDHWQLWLVAVVAAALFSAWAALAVRRRVRRAAMRRRFQRGRAGEQQAEALLCRHGYEVLSDQLRQTTGLWVDDQWHDVVVRADFLVERAGRKYVVEVKTGGKAPNPTSTATRRQLFEYHHVYRADGLILADMERVRLCQIRFADSRRGGATHLVRGFGWATLAACSLAGCLVGGLLAASWLR